jgi:RHH-type rel operon transcriptional repressor/antitoxin RelB
MAQMADTRELTIIIDQELDDELAAIARLTGRDKPSLAREALVEWLEDQEDIRDAIAVIDEDNPSIPIDEVKRRLGLDS